MEVGKPKRLGRENVTGETDRVMRIPRVMASSPCVTPLFSLAYFPCSPLSSLTFLPLLPTLLLSATTTAARPVFAFLDPTGHSPQGQVSPRPSKRAEIKGVELLMQGRQESRLHEPVLGLTMIPECSQETRGWGRNHNGAGLQRTASIWAEKGHLFGQAMSSLQSYLCSFPLESSFKTIASSNLGGRALISSSSILSPRTISQLHQRHFFFLTMLKFAPLIKF